MFSQGTGLTDWLGGKIKLHRRDALLVREVVEVASEAIIRTIRRSAASHTRIEVGRAHLFWTRHIIRISSAYAVTNSASSSPQMRSGEETLGRAQ